MTATELRVVDVELLHGGAPVARRAADGGEAD